MTEFVGHGSTRLLVCEQCGRDGPPDARGWRACLLAYQDGPFAVFCPECAEPEFGESTANESRA